MVYCAKCGKKNEDDAEYCGKCGASLTGVETKSKKKEDRCEEECAVGERSPTAKFFWGALILIVGLAILFNVVIQNTTIKDDLPSWLVNFDFWWIILLLIAIAFIVTGLRIVTRK